MGKFAKSSQRAITREQIMEKVIFTNDSAKGVLGLCFKRAQKTKLFLDYFAKQLKKLKESAKRHCL